MSLWPRRPRAARDRRRRYCPDAGGGTSTGGPHLRSAGRTDAVARWMAIAPGEDTGWHHHPGRCLVIAMPGTLTRLPRGTVETTPARRAFVEEGGPRHIHIGHNPGNVLVVLHTTYLVPEGRLLSVKVPAPMR